MQTTCPRCYPPNSVSENRPPRVSCAGRFYRKSDGQWVSRFKCHGCKYRFSRATFHAYYRQKKRQLNFQISKNLCSGVSQRRMALNLNTSRTTIARKLKFLGEEARAQLALQNLLDGPAQEIEFDDLETFEHTKCKPLSVILAVKSGSRRILGFEVARMPANGHLAKKSQAKYGPLPDERAQARAKLFARIQTFVAPNAIIKSDQNPHYPADVKKFFPHATHVAFKGRKPRSQGLGELKQGPHDPLFSLNHTFAMCRYGIASLIRKTWCTTKKAECLADRLAIYAAFHNAYLI